MHQEDIRERFAFIERQLYWTGRVRRQDLRAQFGLSEAMAAIMFRHFNAAYPGAMTYDAACKSYVATPNFSAQLYEPDLQHALQLLTPIIPVPSIPRETLDGVAASLRGHLSLDVEYIDVRGARSVRNIEPKVIMMISQAFPPLLGAWCNLRRDWRSFDLSGLRVLGLGGPQTAGSADMPMIPVHLAVGAALSKAGRTQATSKLGEAISLEVPEPLLYQVAAIVLARPDLSVNRDWLRRLEDLVEEIKHA